MISKCNKCGCYSQQEEICGCSCGGLYEKIDPDELLIKIYYQLLRPKKKWYKFRK